MANVLIEETSLRNIGGAIRNKLGVDTKYNPAEMSGAIAEIEGSGAGIPTGGLAGQVLTKKSSDDGDADWEAVSAQNIEGVVPIVDETFTGQVIAQDSGEQSKRLRNIQISTTDLTDGESALEDGVVYLVYE